MRYTIKVEEDKIHTPLYRASVLELPGWEIKEEEIGKAITEVKKRIKQFNGELSIYYSNHSDVTFNYSSDVLSKNSTTMY